MDGRAGLCFRARDLMYRAHDPAGVRDPLFHAREAAGVRGSGSRDAARGITPNPGESRQISCRLVSPRRGEGAGGAGVYGVGGKGATIAIGWNGMGP